MTLEGGKIDLNILKNFYVILVLVYPNTFPKKPGFKWIEMCGILTQKVTG